jgi:flagellar biosynthesis component FlhA
MIEASNPGVIVLSYNEIAQGVNIKSIGMVKADKNEN